MDEMHSRFEADLGVDSRIRIKVSGWSVNYAVYALEIVARSE